ncbi:MAG: LptF/LptG family permease [Bacteroidota bacterium]
MKLLDRYIVKQYIVSFLFILGMVLVICVLVDLVEKIDEFIDKDPPLREIIFEYYLNFIPYYGNLLTPLCIYLGVIFFTSQMSQRTELIPVLSSGVSFYRVLAPYLFASLLMAGVSFFLRGYVIPNTTEIRIEFEYKYFKKKRISSNKNVHKKIAEDTFFYISYYNEKRKEGHTISIERWIDGDIQSRLYARKAMWVDSTKSWKMEKVRIRDFIGTKGEKMQYFSTLDTTLLIAPNDIYVREQEAETRTNPELADFIRLEEMRGSDILLDLYIEQARRYSDPVAIIVLTMIGFAMASKKSRGGIAFQIGMGLLLSFLYIGLLFGGRALVSDDFPIWATVWLPNALFFAVSLFLLRIAPK